MGVEPTWTGLQPVALPSGSSVFRFSGNHLLVATCHGSVLARNRTWSTTFAKSRAFRHTPRTGGRMNDERQCAAAFLTIHPSSFILSPSTPPRNRTPSCSSEDCRAVRHTRRAYCQKYPDLDSNQDQDLRGVLCDPLHHRDTRADDWTCTSIIRFTKPAPNYSATSAKARVRGVEPRRPGLEAGCSPKSTLV